MRLRGAAAEHVDLVQEGQNRRKTSFGHDWALGPDEVFGGLLSYSCRTLRMKRVVVGCSSPGLGNKGRACGRFGPKWGRTRKVGSEDMLMSGWGDGDGIIRDWKDFDKLDRDRLGISLGMGRCADGMDVGADFLINGFWSVVWVLISMSALGVLGGQLESRITGWLTSECVKDEVYVLKSRNKEVDARVIK
ncbi:hypothetical protein L1887_11011 [Cichorium endivia]|nr:hypothetical protein L1887_11011 [Cichorium endivia]